jgi:putative FmdB family regulatory protein
MPLYVYKCTECAEIYEDLVSLRIDQDGVDITIHPKCSLCGGAGKKQISSPSFRINGYSEKNGYS